MNARYPVAGRRKVEQGGRGRAESKSHTVESHRNNFMQKLGLHNTAEIVIYAMRKKIIS